MDDDLEMTPCQKHGAMVCEPCAIEAESALLKDQIAHLESVIDAKDAEIARLTHKLESCQKIIERVLEWFPCEFCNATAETLVHEDGCPLTALWDDDEEQP